MSSPIQATDPMIMSHCMRRGGMYRKIAARERKDRRAERIEVSRDAENSSSSSIWLQLCRLKTSYPCVNFRAEEPKMINPSCVAQPRFDPVVPSFLQEIANAFGAIDGVEAVAWSGSSAMGAADSYSDFDFYVYAHAPVPVAAARARRGAASRAAVP